MLVLHGGVFADRLCLWGEAAVAAPEGRAGEALAGLLPTAPMDAGADALLAACARGGIALGNSANSVQELIAWLPTRRGRPLPSTALVASPEPPAAGAARIRPWLVTVVPLDGGAALDLLRRCAGKNVLAPGVAIGAELAWCVELLRLAAELVAAQAFLPGVRMGIAPRACFEPLLRAPERARLRRHAAAMPASLRALGADESAPVATLAEEIAEQLLGMLVDAIVRAPRQDAANGEAGGDGMGELEADGAGVRRGQWRGAAPAPTEAITRGSGRTVRAAASNGGASAHERWMAALCTSGAEDADGRLELDDGALATLAVQVRAWREPLLAQAAAPFRLGFRLEEPAADGAWRPAPEVEAEAADSDAGAADVEAMPDASSRIDGEADTGAGSEDDADGDIDFAPAAHWRVRFLLQDVDDPSLLLPVRDAFTKRKGRAATALLARRGFDAAAHALRSLGEAVRLCPLLERGIEGRVPDACELDTAEVATFLQHDASSLEQAGFAVLLPASLAGRGRTLRLKAHGKTPPMQSEGIGGLITFDWKVAIGDQELTEAELGALAAAKVPLVRVRGQWVQVHADQIAAALRFLERRGHGTLAARDALGLALGNGELDPGLPIGEVTADGWFGRLLEDLRSLRFEELPPPPGLAATLRPYQVRGWSWLAFLSRFGLGACLADDMGLGKTVQALALFAWLQRERELRETGAPREPSEPREPRASLLVCPTSVLGNWQREAARFAPELRVALHHGVERARGDELSRTASRHDVVLTSYALLQRDYAALGAAPWRAVVLDEAQNIKNPNAKQSRAARALRAEIKVALTGTPVENHVGELWALMEFLNPGLLGNAATFKRRFFLPIQGRRDAAAQARLRALTQPFVLRRLKTDRTVIADLPEKMEANVLCTLTREQASLYAAVVAEAERALERASGITRKGIVLATLTRLKQVCNHPAHFLGDGSARGSSRRGTPAKSTRAGTGRTPADARERAARSGKLTRLTEMLEEVLATDDRALVFTQYTEMGMILQDWLQETFGREVAFLHGGVAKRGRDDMVARFQHEAGGPPILVLSLKAGGTGLNLTRASHVFHFDRWWNPAVEDQATDRAFRIGQTRNVQVHKLLCVGTLEERIDALIAAKRDVAYGVVGTGEGWLTELSTEELRGLFALAPEAVAE